MTRSNNDRFDGRAVNPYLDDDGDWLAHLVELPEVSAFAATRARALDELAQALEGVCVSYKAQNLSLDAVIAQKLVLG